MESFRAYRVEKEADTFVRSVKTLRSDSLPPGEVTVRVAYSSLNYKDALSASGHPGVSRSFPHTPGIDAAGTVIQSERPEFEVGDEVIVTSYDLGMNTPGGFAELIRVPGSWVVPLPEGMTLRQAMVLGTAGFTAALCADALLRHGLESEPGPVLVTGASGGVGSLAVALLSKLGFEVTASTGSKDAHALLRNLGASAIVERSELSQDSAKPMLKASWAGAVDTVGGSTLVNIVKSLQPGGAVAACGLVGGAELNLSVYPFILRGVSLLGVDSQNTPMDLRRELWNRLADSWTLDHLDPVTTEISLVDLDAAVEAILQGRTKGRILVNVSGN